MRIMHIIKDQFLYDLIYLDHRAAGRMPKATVTVLALLAFVCLECALAVNPRVLQSRVRRSPYSGSLDVQSRTFTLDA